MPSVAAYLVTKSVLLVPLSVELGSRTTGLANIVRIARTRAEELLEVLGDHVGPIDKHEMVGIVDEFYLRVRQLLPEPRGHRGSVVDGLVPADERKHRDAARGEPFDVAARRAS